MKRYIYFLLLTSTAVTVTVAQQRNTQLTRRQERLAKIKEGTTYSWADAERVLQQQEDGWKLCTAGAFTALTTASLWAALGNKDLLCSYVACPNPQTMALDYCCRGCGYTTCILCSVGCMALCNCDC